MRIRIKAKDSKKDLYHATYGEYLDSIMEKGLIPGYHTNWEFSWSKVVYLTTDPDIAESMAETAELIYEEAPELMEDIVILKIDRAGLDKSKLQADENINIDNNYSFQYKGKISPQYISIYKRIKANDSKVYSGKEVADYFRDITEIDESITKIGLENLIRNYVIDNEWELKDISVNEVLKDPDFKHYWGNIDSEEDIYEDYWDRDLDDWSLNQPIILYQDDNKTFLVDGYHRTAQHLLDEDSTIKAFINLREGNNGE